DDAGAVGRRLEEHGAGAEATGDLVGNRAVEDRHAHHALLRLVDALPDRLGHLLRLAEAEADVARLVADDDGPAEAAPPAGLHDLRDAVDVDDFLLQLDAVRVGDDPARAAARTISLGHTVLPRTSTRPRARLPPPRARGRGRENRCGRRRSG